MLKLRKCFKSQQVVNIECNIFKLYDKFMLSNSSNVYGYSLKCKKCWLITELEIFWK